MVEFEFKPIRKIIVHEILKWSLDEFVKRFVKQNITLQWVDGIIMIRSNYQTMTPKMIEDEADGIVHWALVEFAVMPELVSELVNENTKTISNVNDVSNNNVFRDFARWLKSDPRWFPKNDV